MTVRVLTWDWKEQPDLDRLAAAIGDLSAGHLRMYPVDTESDQFAVVLSTEALDDDEVRRAYEHGGEALVAESSEKPPQWPSRQPCQCGATVVVATDSRRVMRRRYWLWWSAGAALWIAYGVFAGTAGGLLAPVVGQTWAIVITAAACVASWFVVLRPVETRIKRHMADARIRQASK